MRKIRVAYVVSHPIQYQAGLLRHLAADPEIDLLVMFCSDFSVAPFRDEGFGVTVQWDIPLTEGYRFVVLPRLRDTSSPGPARPLSFGFFRQLSRGLDGQPFDAVWVHGYASVNSLHAMVAARALGLPVLLRAESWLQDRERSTATLLAKRVFFRVLRCLVDATLPIGSRNADYWAHYFGPDYPSFAMPYAVDNEFFAARAQAATALRADLQRDLALKPGRPVILFASKLQERKHCDDLLEAYLALRNSDPSLAPYLVIVGDGEMRASLEARALASGCRDVRFAGFRNQGALPAFFDLSTVFVLPSRHEPWGLITNEAMAAGMPVIVSSDVGCAADLVKDGENGYVYPAGDRVALRHALESVLEPGVAEEMGQRSRQRLANWSYAEDAKGLRAALRFVSGRNIERGSSLAEAV